MWIRAHHPEMHPRIHNLAKLAEAIPLSLSPEQMSFLLDANQFYLKGRYPEEKSEFYKICTPEFTQENFNAIKDFHRWLLKQF